MTRRPATGRRAVVRATTDDAATGTARGRNGARASRAVPRRIAAIDIGSNSIRQTIADVSATGDIRVLDEMRAMPRLGEGLERTGELSQHAMELAIAAVTRMVQLAKQSDVDGIEIVATSAVRDAGNAAVFTQQLSDATGYPVRVLSGDAEAMLCFRSAQAHFDLGSRRALVMDIGGGSLEFVLAKDGVVERVVSLPFGAVRLTERFLQPDIRPKRVQALRDYVREGLRRAAPVKDWRGVHAIGSGGTFTNLAGIVLARHGVDARSAHGTPVTRSDLEHVLEWLQHMTPEERAAVPGLNPERADIIVAGLAVAAEVMSRFQSRELAVSGYGIREGMLLEAARVPTTASDPGDLRQRSVRQLAERCHFEEPHAMQVQRLALQLFDATSARLGLTASDRAILADAALLHDIGYHINYDKHHKHSYHLISHAELLGMTPSEQVAIAHVARYHRGSAPRKSHREYQALAEPLRRRITVLAAILRVADGFDRAHVGGVQSLQVRWLPSALRIQAKAPRGRPLRLELWGAARKCALLESVIGRPVQIVAPGGAVVTPELDA